MQIFNWNESSRTHCWESSWVQKNWFKSKSNSFGIHSKTRFEFNDKEMKNCNNISSFSTQNDKFIYVFNALNIWFTQQKKHFQNVYKKFVSAFMTSKAR